MCWINCTYVRPAHCMQVRRTCMGPPPLFARHGMHLLRAWKRKTRAPKYRRLRPQSSADNGPEGSQGDDLNTINTVATASSTTGKSAPYAKDLRTGFVENMGWFQLLKQAQGRLAYQYFLWRQDTLSDLQLFTVFNLGVIFTAGIVKALWVNRVDSPSGTDLWTSIYEVLMVMFTQDLPDPDESGPAQQLFGIAVAGIGLAVFALVLALVEQLVLQVLEANVQQGSEVYERDHVLILAWCTNQRNLEVVWKIASQLCLAYRCEGGRTLVVLCEREKLEMEQLFRRVLPDAERYGSRFVFRQGSPLVPDDLRRVAAAQAAATIIVNDSSRNADESDAQSLRAAVLLDELVGPGGAGGNIVVETRTANILPLIAYATSPRIFALPTLQINAKRLSRMVRQPVVGVISRSLFNFASPSQGYLVPTTTLVGRRFDQLPFFFPDGIVFGLCNPATGRCVLIPPGDEKVRAGDWMVMMRPTTMASGDYRPLMGPVQVSVGDWDPANFEDRAVFEGAVEVEGSIWESQDGNMLGGASRPTDLYMLPLEYCTGVQGTERLLICGWGESGLMAALLSELDHGDSALAPGSQVTLFNSHDSEEVMGVVYGQAKLRGLRVQHIRGDPIQRAQLSERLNIAAYNCAIVLCDAAWEDPDMDTSNGIQSTQQVDNLRLDALIMLVQLNIRKLLDEAGSPDINLICEKVAFDGLTRFEDRYRLPAGISINLKNVGAIMLAECAYDARVLVPYGAMTEVTQLLMQDAAAFAAPYEELSFWQLQARAISVGQVLFAWARLPRTVEEPFEVVINPEGDALRSRTRVWNKGDGRMKLITIAPRPPPEAEPPTDVPSSAEDSDEDADLFPESTPAADPHSNGSGVAAPGNGAGNGRPKEAEVAGQPGKG